MEKKHVFIAQKLLDYKCPICSRTVFVALAKPCTIETDKSIIHTWDYGHQHRRLFEIVNDEQLLVEDSVDYD